MKPVLVPACRAYSEFVFDFDVFYFTHNRHDKIPIETLRPGHRINVAGVLQQL
jgi:hypothetical protein